MNNRITTLVPALIPLALLLGGCSSASHPSRFESANSMKAPGLKSAESFAVLAGATVTNLGASTVVGDVGVDPGTSVTGFPPAIQTGGSMHKADVVAVQAQKDLTAAYDELAGDGCTVDMSGTDLGGLTLGEGVYCFTSSAQLTGTLTLDAKGKAGAVFVFKMVSKLTTASNASVLMINGASPCDVFWQVGSSATVGTNTTFVGSILALTSIALQTGATVDGRALARNGAVTLDHNHIAIPVCVVGDAGPSDAGAVDSGSPDAGEDTAPLPPCDESNSNCL